MSALFPRKITPRLQKSLKIIVGGLFEWGGSLGYTGDEKLPSLMGIIKSQYKDPY